LSINELKTNFHQLKSLELDIINKTLQKTFGPKLKIVKRNKERFYSLRLRNLQEMCMQKLNEGLIFFNFSFRLIFSLDIVNLKSLINEPSIPDYILEDLCFDVLIYRKTTVSEIRSFGLCITISRLPFVQSIHGEYFSKNSLATEENFKTSNEPNDPNPASSMEMNPQEKDFLLQKFKIFFGNNRIKKLPFE
jgi:hypothetical protein